jgi:hypothetical protein
MNAIRVLVRDLLERSDLADRPDERVVQLANRRGLPFEEPVDREVAAAVRHVPGDEPGAAARARPEITSPHDGAAPQAMNA